MNRTDVRSDRSLNYGLWGRNNWWRESWTSWKNTNELGKGLDVKWSRVVIQSKEDYRLLSMFIQIEFSLLFETSYPASIVVFCLPASPPSLSHRDRLVNFSNEWTRSEGQREKKWSWMYGDGDRRPVFFFSLSLSSVIGEEKKRAREKKQKEETTGGN